MDRQTIKYLYHAYLSGSLDAQELSEFRELVNKGDDTILNELIDADWNRLGGVSAPMELRNKVMTAVAETSQAGVQRSHRHWYIKVAVAAAFISMIFGVWFFVTQNKSGSHTSNINDAYANDVAPGKRGATLTLSTGEQLNLDSAKQGVSIGQNLKYVDGTEITSFPLNNENLIVKAETGYGQTYEITLPDGTHVFLNTNSRISFPSRFQGKERRIRLEGEAYFQVVHNDRQPFFVESGDQIVQDIGTEFNIKAYNDELTTRTTLIEGSASVERRPLDGKKIPEETKILKPSQQAISTADGIDIVQVDTDVVVAWKDGYFLFEQETLGNIFLTASRWYNVKAVFEKEALKNLKFSGSVNRFANISELLRMLELTKKVSFRITGNTIYVDQHNSK